MAFPNRSLMFVQIPLRDCQRIEFVEKENNPFYEWVSLHFWVEPRALNICRFVKLVCLLENVLQLCCMFCFVKTQSAKTLSISSDLCSSLRLRPPAITVSCEQVRCSTRPPTHGCTFLFSLSECAWFIFTFSFRLFSLRKATSLRRIGMKGWVRWRCCLPHVLHRSSLMVVIISTDYNFYIDIHIL